MGRNIDIILMIAFFIYLVTPAPAPAAQIGGWYDPYQNVRFWIIADILRNFWLTG